MMTTCEHCKEDYYPMCPECGEEQGDEEDSSSGAVALFLLLIVALMITASWMVGNAMAMTSMRTEAIQRGYADWDVVDDKGRTEFRWRMRDELTK